MDTLFRHQLIADLGGAAAAFNAGAAGWGRAELSAIPEALLEELLGELAEECWATSDAACLASLLTTDPRARVRGLAAALSSRPTRGLRQW